jgi:hypothetical protein
LISAYIPSSAFSALVAAETPAASSASVVYSDATALVYSALLATSVPAWFNSAVPAAYKTQIAALESNLQVLRGSVTGDITPGATFGPVIIGITTTDAAGSTVVVSITTILAIAT